MMGIRVCVVVRVSVAPRATGADRASPSWVCAAQKERSERWVSWANPESLVAGAPLVQRGIWDCMVRGGTRDILVCRVWLALRGALVSLGAKVEMV